MTNSCTKYAVIILLALCGCTSKLVVQSDPPQADVFFSIEGRPEKVKAGQTPLELTEPALMELLKISADSSLWIELTLEKKDFEKRVVMLPSNRWGEASRSLKLQLKPMDDNTTTVKKMMRYFFNAKKFAETKQFEQAHSEIDKVLALDSEMPQALNMKAGIYFLQGQMADAKANYKKALDIDPGSNEAIQMLEKIQNKSGSTQ
jgi:tetratricopeptide (TPR) repeat protein